ncbi:MAG: hypothetical protein PHR53_01475 [Bacteroidales bacterium]|nr:hypothetical protein [Bacteroidales bacterium]
MSEKKNISEELLARYLERKTNAEETKQVLDYLASDSLALNELLLASQETAFQQIETEKQGKKKSIYARSILSKNDLDDDTRYQIAGHGKVAMAAETDCGFKTCAIQAQQIVLQDYGVNVSTNELTQIAQENGWYIEQQGTPMDFVGELLNYFNINAVQMRNANIYHLIHELSQGHKIIVGVDSNELEQTATWRNYDEVMHGKEANHVLVVAGIDTSNPNDLQVVLTDPTKADFQKRYPAQQFLEAWEDSGYFMVATQNPAPLAYNPEMQNFDYQRGFVEEFADIAYTEIVKRLADDGYIGNGKNNNCLKNLFFSLLIILIAVAAMLAAWRFFTPMDMKILITEKADHKIPAIPFEKGTLSVSYSDLAPQIFTITPENQMIVVSEINYKHKNKKAHIVFQSAGYQTIDTIVSINKRINLFITKDNSYGVVFGTIIDGVTGQPVENAELNLQDIVTQSDASGNFKINIPLEKQAKEQRLQVYKVGYQLWVGTYQPSPTNSWEIVLIPKK